jgi:ubiquinone/menaquinone biosynthesis C-methylase UbiE
VSVLDRAEAYDRHAGRYASELAVGFMRFAGVAPGMRALDVGCGPGALARELARVLGAARVGAVDPCEEYVDACRQRVPGADVRPGTAEELPFADRAFQAVLAQLVVQVLDDAPRAVGEMLRVAAPGGIVAACVWDFQGGMPLLAGYWKAAQSVDPEGARRAGADDTNPWCTPEGLRQLWRDAGLQEVVTGELAASAEYDGVDDAWWSFAAGVGPSGAYCRSLDEERRMALREEFRRRLGGPEGPFSLTARAWSVRGRAPGA